MPSVFQFLLFRELSDLVLGEQQCLELFFSEKRVENPLCMPNAADVDASFNIFKNDKYITIDADNDDVDCNDICSNFQDKSVDLTYEQSSNMNDMNINGFEESNLQTNKTKNKLKNDSKERNKNKKPSTTSDMLTDYGSIRILRIRNPWGKKEWQGDFAEKSEVWTGKMRKILDKGQCLL